MENISVIILFLYVLLPLVGSGVWICLALMENFLGWHGAVHLPARDDVMLTTIWSVSSSWTFTALPMFTWMEEILYRTRLSEDMFKGLSHWMTSLPGQVLAVMFMGYVAIYSKDG